MKEDTEIDAAAATLGALPVCSLADTWNGMVWLKPTASECSDWVDAAIARYRSREITAALFLMVARTDSRHAQKALRYCTAVCFIRSRIRFQGEEGGAPFPSMVLYFGPNVKSFNETFKPLGMMGQPG